MGIDMSNYKMIYKDQVYNVVGIIPGFSNVDFSINGIKKPSTLEATIIDEDGEIKIIRDEAWMFKFVRR
jgi:hypothetical protein